jgi:hypothetical protein
MPFLGRVRQDAFEYKTKGGIMQKFLIPFPDYKRIFLTLFSVLKSEKADINHSCTYFSIIGAYILQEHYQIEAKVGVGLALYMVNAEKEGVLTFGEKDGDTIFSSDNGFHAWVEADGWVIDFMAPLFSEMIKHQVPCPSKMFQRSFTDMCNSPTEFSASGDFFVSKDIHFSNEVIDQFHADLFKTDMIKLCCQWYRKPPRKMKAMGISNQQGDVKKISLNDFNIGGAW